MMIRKKGRGTLAALLVLCLLLSACGASGTAAPDDAIDTGADDDWTAVEDGTLRLENDRVLWEMDVPPRISPSPIRRRARCTAPCRKMRTAAHRKKRRRA